MFKLRKSELARLIKEQPAAPLKLECGPGFVALRLVRTNMWAISRVNSWRAKLAVKDMIDMFKRGGKDG